MTQKPDSLVRREALPNDDKSQRQKETQQKFCGMICLELPCLLVLCHKLEANLKARGSSLYHFKETKANLEAIVANSVNNKLSVNEQYKRDA